MAQASNEYLRNAVLTASPEQLQLMLYDGAIRFTRRGMDGLRRKDYEAAFEGFSRAQKIVLEMLNSLNYDVDAELCRQMAALYNFVYRKLVEASSTRDPALAEEALGILDYQRETWVMLIDKLRVEVGPARALPDAPDREAMAEPVYGTLSVEG